MSVLAEIVRNVLVIIILASFLELLLPAGTIRPFVRFAIGLFVLIAVLNPVLGYLFHDNDFQLNWWECKINEDIEESIVAGGRQINERILNQNQQMLKEKLEGQISAVILLVPGIEEVHTQAELRDSTIDRLKFNILLEETEGSEEAGEIEVFIDEEYSAEMKQQIERKINNVVSNMYGLGPERIEINFEGGG
ncbi:stage iii sporulation protein af [hydrocarbon metagenome]|uniref:Stage iii sporulation protein af n=1 Tax=hydrocarbon metagenome TaxID=938273 RepID=A0A0W8E8T3_9ZZZZ